MLPVVSASSAQSKTPYFFFAQEPPPLKMAPPQMIIGYLQNQSTFLLTPLGVLPYRSLTNLFPCMDVQAVRVLRGTVLSAHITITRDASDQNIPF